MADTLLHDLHLPDPTVFFPGDEVRTRIRQLDQLLSLFFLTPLIILFWHGIDGILFKIILQFSPLGGSLLLVVVGVAVQVLLSSAQDHCREFAQQLPTEKQKIFRYVFRLVLALSQIAQYVGFENLCRMTFERDASNGLRIALTGVVLLTGLQVTQAVLDSPLVLTVDAALESDDIFSCDSYHSVEPGLHTSHVLDALATYGVIQLCVHAFVVGVWTFLDGILGSETSLISCIFSWSLGAALVLTYGAARDWLKSLLRAMEERYGNITAHLFTDCVIYVVAFGGISVWRSVWVFYDFMAYYFPIRQGSTEVTPFYEIVVAYVALILCHISSSASSAAFVPYHINSSSERRLPEPVEYFSYFFETHIAQEEERATEGKRSSQMIEPDPTDVKNGPLPSNGHPAKVTRQNSKGLQKQSSLEEKPFRKKKLSLQDLVGKDQQRRGPKK